MSSIKLPRISLVTTCLNQLPQLQQCVGSVLDQQYPQLEYIIIDRGSSDGSLEFLHSLSGSTITVVEEPQLGQADAINRAFAMVSGSIMGLLDPQDKQFHLGLFKVALLFLNDWKVNWIAGKQARLWASGDFIEDNFHAWNIPGLIGAYQQDSLAFPQSATFWRRALYELAGARFGPGQGDDAMLDLWLRFYEHVDLHSADTLIAGFQPGVPVTTNCVAANRAVIQRSQGLINNANRRSVSPGSLRCALNPGDLLQLLRHTRPGYIDVDGVSVFQGDAATKNHPRLLVCYGLPKSASSFTWKLACNIASGEQQQYVISRQLPPALSRRFMNPVDERALDIADLLPPGATYVLKTHGEVSPAVRALVAAGVAKAVISVRDPFDIVASLMDVGVTERARPVENQRAEFTSIHTFEDALHYLLAFLPGCREWLEFAKQHDFPVIHFERVKNSPETIADRVAQLLGTTVDPEALVSPLVSNKSKNIPEFNVGISGRGRKLFENFNNPAVSEVLDEFENLFREFEP